MSKITQQSAAKAKKFAIADLPVDKRIEELFAQRSEDHVRPLGEEEHLLSLLSPLGVFKRRVSEACNRCMACRKGCPTQAIRLLSLDEKTHARIGTAIIRKENCLVWAQDKMCLICDEICPYNAIVFRPIDGYRRPVVIASRCNGRGYCEQRCPVRGESAIVVVPDGEIRLKEGSYITEAKKLNLELKLSAASCGESLILIGTTPFVLLAYHAASRGECARSGFKPDPGDDKFVIEESGFKVDPERQEEKRPPAEKPAPQKPKGFL